MQIKKDFLKVAGLVCLSFTLQGCFDSYPKSGKFEGNHFISSKYVAKSSNIFKVTPAMFADWKALEAELNDISTLTEPQLLDLRNKFVDSKYVDLNARKSNLLADANFDLDSIIDAEYQESQGNINKMKQALISIQPRYDELQAKKQRANDAKMKLDNIRSDIQRREDKLLNEFNQHNEKVVNVFKKFGPNDIGVATIPTTVIERASPYKVYEYRKPSAKSCREYMIENNRFDVKRFEAYIYSKRVTVQNKTFCPVFKTLGQTLEQQKQLFASLSETEKDLIRSAASSYAIYRKEKIALDTERNSVNRNNPALVLESRSFDFAEKHELNKLERTTQQGKDYIAKASAITKETIKKDKLTLLASQLERAKQYYLYGKLLENIEQESTIQPDGTFNLPSGSDFYIVKVGGDKAPHNMLFALLRMEQFKNKERVDLKADEFFKFSQLSDIKL